MVASSAGTMKAIVQNGYGSPDVLELREIEKPPVTDGTFRVRVRAASVNAADWHLLKRLPHVISMVVVRRRDRLGFAVGTWRASSRP